MGRKKRKKTSKQQCAVTHRRKRSHRKYTLYYFLALILLLAVGAALSLTVFFKVADISVEGSARYPAEELIDVSGIRKGDNLCRIDTEKARKALVDQYPYLTEATIRRKWPNTVTICVTQAQCAEAVEIPEGYLLMDERGRVLEQQATLPEGFSRVVGLDLGTLLPGQYIVNPKASIEEQNLQRERFRKYEILLSLTEALATHQMDKIVVIDLSDDLNLRLLYDGRIDIELGSQLDIDYKVRFAKAALDKTDDSMVGVLDVTTRGSAYLRPQDIFQPNHWRFPDNLLDDYKRVVEKPTIPLPNAATKPSGTGTSDSNAAPSQTPGSKPEPEPNTDPMPDSQPEPKPESELKPKPESEPEHKPEPKPESQPESQPESKPPNKWVPGPGELLVFDDD